MATSVKTGSAESSASSAETLQNFSHQMAMETAQVILDEALFRVVEQLRSTSLDQADQPLRSQEHFPEHKTPQEQEKGVRKVSSTFSTKSAISETLSQVPLSLEETLVTVRALFEHAESGDRQVSGLQESHFDIVAEACGLPSFLGSSLWRYVSAEWDETGLKDRKLRHKRVSFDAFAKKWSLLCASAKTPTQLLFQLLKGSSPRVKSLSAESFEPLLRDIIMTHSDLLFLQGNNIFQERYLETVMTRIFYHSSRSPPAYEDDIINGRAKGVTQLQFAKCGFVDALDAIHTGTINDERMFFSYKHFFIIYCRFYDLEISNNLRVLADQLLEYNNGALNELAAERAGKGYGYSHAWRTIKNGQYLLQTYTYNGCRAKYPPQDSGIDVVTSVEQEDIPGERRVGEVSFIEFIWFILSEEDRTSETAIEFWFRILDLDEDGVLSLFELEQFWKQQETKLVENGWPGFEYRDILCIALDLIKHRNMQTALGDVGHRPLLTPSKHTALFRYPDRLENPTEIAVTLKDLKSNPPLASRFFDYFINWQKLVERENTNGNRLQREIDELQQQFYQELIAEQTVRSRLKRLSPTKNDASKTSTYAKEKPFAPLKIPVDDIPSDTRSHWARWVEAEYDNYILMEEHEQQRRQEALSDDEDVHDNDQNEDEGNFDHDFSDSSDDNEDVTNDDDCFGALNDDEKNLTISAATHVLRRRPRVVNRWKPRSSASATNNFMDGEDSWADIQDDDDDDANWITTNDDGWVDADSDNSDGTKSPNEIEDESDRPELQVSHELRVAVDSSEPNDTETVEEKEATLTRQFSSSSLETVDLEKEDESLRVDSGICPDIETSANKVPVTVEVELDTETKEIIAAEEMPSALQIPVKPYMVSPIGSLGTVASAFPSLTSSPPRSPISFRKETSPEDTSLSAVATTCDSVEDVD